MIDSLRLGGAEALLAGLVGGLAELGCEGVVVAVSRHGADPGLLAAIGATGVDVEFLDGRRLYDPKILAGVLRVARRNRIDLMHSHLSQANVNSRLAATLLRRPHVTTIHTLAGPKAEDSRASILADGWTARLSDVIVAPSQELATAYRQAFRLAPAKFRVIPNAPAARRPAAGFDRDELRRELLGGSCDKLVVCIARLQAEKGIDELIDAAGSLRSQVDGVRVVVAGDGPEGPRLRGRIEAEGKADAITLLGARSDVGELLAVADAFCLPSRHEGVPLSLLEAMAAGRPCVVTAVGGIPGLVTDGRNALLVQPRDVGGIVAALARVLTDAETGARLGRNAERLISECYSPASLAARYASLYGDLAESR